MKVDAYAFLTRCKFRDLDLLKSNDGWISYAHALPACCYEKKKNVRSLRLEPTTSVRKVARPTLP